MSTAQFRFNPNDQDAIVGVQDVSALLVGSFQINPCGYAWSAAEFTVVYDVGLGQWTDYPSLAVIDGTNRSSGRIDLSWVNAIALKVSTVEGTSRRWEGVFSGHG